MRLAGWKTVGAAALAVWTWAAPQASARQTPSSRLSGYYEHQYSLSRVASDWRQIDYDRLRADLNVRVRGKGRASAGVVYQLYRGDTTVDPSEFLPAGIVGVSDSLDLVLDDRHYLNHAYIVVGGGPIEVTAGKQFLTWGAAWVFNPTELFRPKNALEPSYDREGVGAVSARLTLGPMSDLLVAYVPDGGLSSSGKLLRVRRHASGVDVSALVASRSEQTFGSAPGKTSRRTVIGGDVTGELFGLGAWAEATWSDLEGRRWAEVTLGGNYSLADGTLLLAEGFYNGRGSTRGPYAADAWLERLSGSRTTLGRWTLFAAANRPVGRLWTIGLAVITNAGDGSMVVIPSVAYSFAENIDLLFNGLFNAGGPADEYGVDRLGGFVRGRVYF